VDNRLLIENLATIAAISLLLGALVLGPVGRAFARRIEGRRDDAGDPGLRDALADTEHRVAELESRLDFAERLLSEQRDPQQLERGS
jgi:hypothetical protein